ncbi:SRPBCC family protein [Patiriisocius hiemis]|uniref:SRPBCC family protein n=1 Tax=Patiriisocius hiemis TaxID=3075604 RepID=A0ABU2Y968_9FLAO|nr:SRPBCC family protein [Constantimarinum sp. W242]MDT0554724.1 SRPBCC family protein [Constantimarinum sp. W242]
MFILTIILWILLGILIVLIILALIVPRTYHVERSIIINKPLPEVFAYIKKVKNQDDWSPWKKRDPGMKQTFTGTDGTVGFISKWESDHKHVGHGEQEIINIEENKVMESELRFLKPFKSQSTGFLQTDTEGEKTKVTWGFYGKHKIPLNVMMLFYNMDKAVGKDFEEGLLDLKTVLEK